MTFAEDIYLNVIRAKCTTGCWAWQLTQIAEDGGNTECLEEKFMLLVMWIEIMECYYAQNFDSNKSTITPDVECLTQAQAMQLLAKIKLLIKAS